jgi:hypothetical protein
MKKVLLLLLSVIGFSGLMAQSSTNFTTSKGGQIKEGTPQNTTVVKNEDGSSYKVKTIGSLPAFSDILKEISGLENGKLSSSRDMVGTYDEKLVDANRRYKALLEQELKSNKYSDEEILLMNSELNKLK